MMTTVNLHSLRVLIVSQNIARGAILEDGLRDAGCADVIRVQDTQSLMRRIIDSNPNVICIDLENPERDALEQMLQVSRCVRRPIALFVERADTDMIEAAVEAGIGAYIIDGLKRERIKSIIDMAISRHNAFSKLREELERAKSALDERGIVERAKAVLMKQRDLTEAAAYALLRRAAMNENRRLSEVARSVVTAERLLR